MDEKVKDILDVLKEELDKLESQNVISDEGLRDAMRRKRGYATGALLSDVLSIGGQSTAYQPRLRQTSLIEEKYRTVPSSVIESQAQLLRGQLPALGRQLIESGIRPTQVSNMLANVQGRIADAESGMRYNFFKDQYTTQRSKYGELMNIMDANTAEEIRAREAARDDQNKILSALGRSVSGYIDDLDKIYTNEFDLRRDAQSKVLSNKMDILKNRMALAIAEEQRDAVSKRNQDFLDMLKEVLMKK